MAASDQNRALEINFDREQRQFIPLGEERSFNEIIGGRPRRMLFSICQVSAGGGDLETVIRYLLEGFILSEFSRDFK